MDFILKFLYSDREFINSVLKEEKSSEKEGKEGEREGKEECWNKHPFSTPRHCPFLTVQSC